MEHFTLFTGLLLPWLGGALWLTAIEARLARASRANRLRQAGYGFFLGYAVLFLAVLAFDAVFGRVSWAWIMVLLALLTAGGGIALWLTGPPPGRPAGLSRPLGAAGSLLLLILAAWTGLHLVLAAIEVVNQPLFPWDAWLAWVYRAKAWYLAGGMVDVVSPSQWALAAAADVYTIDAWTYPLFPSVVPYWAALSLGRWSETLVNLPVLLAGIAIGLALYGQCRESGIGPLFSIAACYLLISIPLFATHIALAGYADIWMAGFSGLGYVALMRGAISGQRLQTALGLLLLAFAMLVKNEGAVWLLAALLLLVLISFRWRTNLLAGLVIVAAVWTASLLGVTHVEIPLVGTLGVVDGRLHIPFIGRFALEIHDVWRPYRDNFFVLGSWNLLWVLVAASLLLALVGGRAAANPARRAGAVFIGIFLATQLFIFGFTDQGTWADTYTAINRLPLHFVPALIYAALIVIHSRAWQTQGGGIRLAPTGLTASTGLSQLWPATLLAAVLVVIGSLVFLARGLPENPAEVRTFAAPDLNFVMGSGSANGDRVVIDDFADGYALLSSGPVTIPAEAYRFLRFRLDRRSDGALPTLFWRLSDAPEELVRVPVWKSGAVTLDLSAEDHWHGEVTEVGFLFEESGGQATLGSVELAPDTLTRRIQLAWRNWAAFEPWSQKSINFLQGGASTQLIRLPVLVAAWLALTLLLGWVLTRFRGNPAPARLLAGAAFLFLVAWMILDVRWTANSTRQFMQTMEKYRGVDEAERLRRGLDGAMYSYVERLKNEALPEHPARILIVSDDSFPDYFLQRAKYHLLPHSVTATRRLPAQLSPETLGFVLLLGETADIWNIAGSSRVWQQAPLTQVHEEPHGNLYRVDPAVP